MTEILTAKFRARTTKSSVIASILTMAACQQIGITNPPPTPPAQVSSAADTSPISIDAWRLTVSPGADGTYRIHVADALGHPLQVLDGPEGAAPFVARDLLTLDDYTGDGRPDIRARGLSVGASALASELIYPFDTATGRFIEAERFEQDGEASKTRPGCIAVQYRNTDNTTYSKDAYCWAGGWVSDGGAR